MIYILDSPALLNDENFSFENGNKYFITSNVFNELKDFRSKSLAENAENQGLLTIQDPCPLSVQITNQKCAESGTKISDTDISVIALAIEFRERKTKFVVITDDYSIQNILKKLKINFRGVIQGEIKKHRSFKN
ncbi:MAG: PIN domain-containing protein [archaeon]|nr:PIN domain-containing protein [archaeon]